MAEKQLSQAQCVLLAVHYATECDITSLHALAPSRSDAFSPDLLLRIVLSYLPETVHPSRYTTFVGEAASRIWLEQHEPAQLDVSSVHDISDASAQKRVKKLNLLELLPRAFPPHAPNDPLSHFLCHRAHRIDSETGLLTLVPSLIGPFIDRSDWLRTWFISVVLPLQRFGYEYYPGPETPPSLDTFEDMNSEEGIRLLLSKATHTRHQVTSPTESEGTVGRDLKGLIGPWVYGHTEREMRKRGRERKDADANSPVRKRRISLAGVSHDDKTGHDWEYLYKWLVTEAVQNFALVTNAIEDWDGPVDVDLGEYSPEKAYLDDETQTKLEKQYAQAAFAACYAVEADTPETIDGAHGILVRLAALLDFEPPPDLAASVEQLPKIDKHASLLQESNSKILLEPDVLLQADHPLSSPKLETYMLLQMLVYSAYQLAGLGHGVSIVKVAKLRFFSDEDAQLSLLQKILHRLSSQGKRDAQQWQSDRDKLLWLWSWGIDNDGGALRGAGVFGSIDGDVFEKEILKVLTKASSYPLILQLYIKQPAKGSRLTANDVETVILNEAMQCYDSASNGNRTRGSMKKASDIVNTFRPSFPKSKAFRQASSLIAATHSLSFYSLTLQHGVPFQPVNIRVSRDPISLLPKVLEQNPNSYTKLDDLVAIGRNLVSAGVQTSEPADGPAIEPSDTDDDIASRAKTAERRVILMCIEAALTEDDFETAYSYLVSRLAPEPAALPGPTGSSSARPNAQAAEDDISWRAAFLAGRYRPRSESAANIRRLEQRTELLSLALLLAPASALSEILNVWRRCEEEMSALVAQEAAEERQFDDRADKRHEVPGGFSDTRTEGMVFGQQRREVGRFSAGGKGRGDEEAPMGLFDVARGAAKAFSRNAFPLHGATASAGGNHQQHGGQAAGRVSSESMERPLSPDSHDARVRKRDMVANAVTGSLVSGIGWVLGASPAER